MSRQISSSTIGHKEIDTVDDNYIHQHGTTFNNTVTTSVFNSHPIILHIYTPIVLRLFHYRRGDKIVETKLKLYKRMYRYLIILLITSFK